jgi:hypothetical protein
LSVANAASWSLVKHTTSQRPTAGACSTSGGRLGADPPEACIDRLGKRFSNTTTS